MANRSIIRPVALRTTFPEDIRGQLDLHLYSDIEGRVPKGAYQQFLIERIREYFNSRALDVGPWLDPGGEPLVVRGSSHTIDCLQTALDQIFPKTEKL